MAGEGLCSGMQFSYCCNPAAHIQYPVYQSSTILIRTNAVIFDTLLVGASFAQWISQIKPLTVTKNKLIGIVVYGVFCKLLRKRTL